VSDRDIDAMLNRAAEKAPTVDPALLDRIAGSVGASIRPVRPLPAAWILATGLAAICAAIATLGAARAGLHGIEKLTAIERAVIFPTLGVLLWLAALVSAREMLPAQRRWGNPRVLLAVAIVALEAAFALLFHDYRATRFVARGTVCLAVGLLHAIPAAVAGWLWLRRGFAVEPVAAGLATGAIAGLAGVTMLELHCPNLEALHVLLWHVAVVPISAAAGALWARWRQASRTTAGS